MKNILFSLSLLFTLAACHQPKESIIGNWHGKNHSGQDIQWTFDANGKAISAKGNTAQDMFYSIDATQTPHHLNLNSSLDTNTLRAIYRFSDNGKLIIGINNTLVTKRPKGFSDAGVQKLILTKK